MIFFIGNDGTVITSVPSPVYQGAAEANDIYVVAPFAANLSATVAFKLPNGVFTERYPMTAVNEISGVVNNATGKSYAGWKFSLPNNVTQYFGTVTAQFFFYSAEAGRVVATSSSAFTVGQGVPLIPPDAPSPDVYETILSNLSALQQQINNGNVAARSIYAWNSTYAYGAGELVFYPDFGRYGVFLKSLVADNTTPPYTDGVLDKAKWLLVSDFNILTELYTLKTDMQQAVSDAAASANSAAESAGAAETSSQQAAQSAQTAEDAAARIKIQAEYIEGVRSGDVSVPKATGDETGANIAGQFAEISELIPSSTTPENQLANEAFVNSSINNLAAFYITYNAGGDAFPTRASLLNATTYYYGGQPRTPTQNDYAIVLADESQPKGVDGNYPTTRYSYQGGNWAFQYVVNNTSLTQAQVDAINSGITAAKIASMDAATAAKYTKPSGGIPESDLSANVQGKLNASSSAPQKNLYNLGAYDTATDNGDGTVTITRKTGYKRFTADDVPPYWSGTSGVSTMRWINLNWESYNLNVVGNIKIEGDGGAAWDSTVACLASSTTEHIMRLYAPNTYASPKDFFLQNDVYVEYELATAYTEKVIANQPIHTLNQDGEHWLRDEWEKGLNLLNPNVYKEAAGFLSLGKAYLEKDRTYRFKIWSTNSGNTFTYNDFRIVSGDVIQRISGVNLNAGITFTFTGGDSGTYRIQIYRNPNDNPDFDTFDYAMLSEGAREYSYKPYYGKILREKDLADFFKESSFELAGAAIENSLKKQGKLVLANLTLNNANVAITIPEGFRPKADINVIGYNNTTITIPANGVMKSGSGLLWGFANIGWETN